MNFEAPSPHPVDNCHYPAVLSDVTLTWLECDSAVDPDSVHGLTCVMHCILPVSRFMWSCTLCLFLFKSKNL